MDSGQGLQVCFNCFQEVTQDSLTEDSKNRRRLKRKCSGSKGFHIRPEDRISYNRLVFLQDNEELQKLVKGDREDNAHPVDIIFADDDDVLDKGFLQGGGDQWCDHLKHVVNTRDGDSVCSNCGLVLFDNVDTFHVASLEGAAYTYRKSTYQIRYYHNEKCAQWNRECPYPPDELLDQFMAEIKIQTRYGGAAGLGRASVAAACKRIGCSTMQEKWILLLELCKQRDPEYFRDTFVPPKPTTKLLNQMKRMFLFSLPAWEMSKDIDAGEILKSRYPKTKLPNHYGKKRRKSYPHNYMMRRFLNQIEYWNERNPNPDPDLENCFEIHHHAIKTVSDRIEKWWDVIWEKMCDCMNDLVPDLVHEPTTSDAPIFMFCK